MARSVPADRRRLGGRHFHSHLRSSPPSAADAAAAFCLRFRSRVLRGTDSQTKGLFYFVTLNTSMLCFAKVKALGFFLRQNDGLFLGLNLSAPGLWNFEQKYHFCSLVIQFDCLFTSS